LYSLIYQLLLDAGAPKDLTNCIGWTALHEACFYHRIETVKVLLLAGCDPTCRTRRGALPYHLAGLAEIRSMLENMGGPGAVPADDDVIDMLQVLTDLASPETMYTLDGEEIVVCPATSDNHAPSMKMLTSGVHEVPEMSFDPEESSNEKQPRHQHNSDLKHAKDVDDNGELPLLHSGGVLGDLPNLSPSKISPSKQLHHDANAAFDEKLSPSMFSGAPSRRADDKKGKKKKTQATDVPTDMPKEFLCQLTQKPMSDPVKTIFGNVYDRTAIMNWFSTQGRICPLTGRVYLIWWFLFCLLLL
jgi:hypothetical protein